MPGYRYSESSVIGASGGSWQRVVGGLMVLCWLGALQAAETNRVHPIAIQAIDATAAGKVSYFRDIKPLLANYCVECHGTTEPEGEYQVGSVAELLKSGKKNGPGVIPGKPDESPVVRYIRGELKPQMPKGSPPVSVEGLHLLRQWIAAGAKDDSADAVLAASVERAAWEQFDPREHKTIAKARLSAEEMNALLSDEADAEKRFLARRQWRLTLLPPAPVPPPVKSPAFNAVDKFIAAGWEAHGLAQTVTPPALSTDAAFLRRVYLDVTGVVPTALETHQFLADTNADRRSRLIDRVLAQNEEYAAHWTTFWQDIIGSSDANIRGGILTRGNYRLWIFNSLLRNRPYDLMVAELIDETLPGALKPAEQETFQQIFKVGYLRNDTPLVTMETAANVGQAFLGTSMKCASCHSHFENPEWPQARFIAFASIFSERQLELVRCEKRTGALIPPAFPFEIPSAPKSLPAALPERLQRTAQLLTDPLNPRLAHAFVNRLWKRFFGLGLVEPADDFRADLRASHPELLEWLAQELMRSNYDIKHVIGLILKSRTYQSAYDPKLADVFNPAHPEAPRHFRSPQLRRISAEQLLDSLNLVGSQQNVLARRQMFRKDATVLTQVLGRPASRNEIITSRSEELAVLQLLEMLNGSEYQTFIYRSSLLDLLADENDAATSGQALYLAALSRFPTPAELETVGSHLQPQLDRRLGPKPADEERVIVDETLPRGFTEQKGDGVSAWSWIKGEGVGAHSGAAYRRSHSEGPVDWQGLNLPLAGLPVHAGEGLFTYVYLPPDKPPKSVWIRVFQNDIEHQMVWSDEPVTRENRQQILVIYGGALPKAGGWVRLDVPFRQLQMVAGNLKTVGFGVEGGTAYWDKTGVRRIARSPRIHPLGDVLWSLVTSPEFQYIR